MPFRGTTIIRITSAILRDSLAPLRLAFRRSGRIIQRLLVKQPGARYQRAGEVRAALEGVQPAVSASSPVPVVASSRRRWLWAAGALPLAAAVAWLGLQQWNKSAAPDKEPRLSDGNRPSTNPEANDYYERGLQFAGSGPRGDLGQWRRMLERAWSWTPDSPPPEASTRSRLCWQLPSASSDPHVLQGGRGSPAALRDDPRAEAHSALAGIISTSDAKNGPGGGG